MNVPRDSCTPYHPRYIFSLYIFTPLFFSVFYFIIYFFFYSSRYAVYFMLGTNRQNSKPAHCGIERSLTTLTNYIRGFWSASWALAILSYIQSVPYFIRRIEYKGIRWSIERVWTPYHSDYPMNFVQKIFYHRTATGRSCNGTPIPMQNSSYNYKKLHFRVR